MGCLFHSLLFLMNVQSYIIVNSPSRLKTTPGKGYSVICITYFASKLPEAFRIKTLCCRIGLRSEWKRKEKKQLFIISVI